MHPYLVQKYKAFPAINLNNRTWPDNTIKTPPIWCSVDLRDGNQSLPQPMTIEEKVEFFKLLCTIGFKQIEIGFPSAADSEFLFCRKLIEENLIPEDVTIQILVQTREHLIRRSFEAISGAKKVIVHIYNSTSPLQREITFGNASKEDIKQIAVNGAQLVKELTPTIPETDITLQYSPESFSDTELEFSAECCNAVIDIWQPSEKNRMIINLPDTVQWTTPNVHADQIEWMHRNLKKRQHVDISLHTHNDRGTGTAATELGLMAGADRVEGTLFGNGERTGNLDIVNLSLNMNAHGIPTGLNFSNLPEVRVAYERITHMKVGDRAPYAGELVFTAFSGSHQDAIKKGLDVRNKKINSGESPLWAVPYLTIDPQDIGRSYEAIIRINSQSGKGGVAYILDREHGFDLPKSMHPHVGKTIYDIADSQSKELSPKEIKDSFLENFMNLKAPLELISHSIQSDQKDSELSHCSAKIKYKGNSLEITGVGNGPISAFVNALKCAELKNFTLTDYRSHAIRKGSDSDSVAYIQLQSSTGDTVFWGAGMASSIESAGIKALVSTYNLLQNHD